MFDANKVVDTICSTEQLLAKFGNTDKYDICAENANITLVHSDFVELLNEKNSCFYNCEFTIINNEEGCIGIGDIDLRFCECRFNTNFEVLITNPKVDKVFLFDECEFISNISVSLSVHSDQRSLRSFPAIVISNCIIHNKLDVCGDEYYKTQYNIKNCKIKELEICDSDIILNTGENCEIGIIAVRGNGSSKVSSLDYCKIDTVVVDGYRSIQQNQRGGLLILRNTIKDSYFEMSLHYRTMIFHNVSFGKGFKYLDLFKEAKDNDYFFDIYACNCNFKSYVDISYTNYNILDFEESTFVGKFHLSESKADNLKFKGCKFSDSAKLYNFRKEIDSAIFSHSTINDLFIFNGWNGRTLDLSDKNTIVDFSNIFVKSDGYLILKNINSSTKAYCGDFNFKNSNILGSVIFSKVYANSIDLRGASIIGRFFTENIAILDLKNRSTCSKLKNEYLKRNDTITALEYKSKELDYSLKELDKPFGWLFKNRLIEVLNILLLPITLILSLVPHIKFNILRDYTALVLHKTSSYFGMRWDKGVIFTIITAFTFYTIYYFSLSGNIILWFPHPCKWLVFDGEYMKEVLSYMWLLNTDSIKELINNSTISLFSSIIFIIGKIFIAFGIYQTITAFRKYGK